MSCIQLLPLQMYITDYLFTLNGPNHVLNKRETLISLLGQPAAAR